MELRREGSLVQLPCLQMVRLRSKKIKFQVTEMKSHQNYRFMAVSPELVHLSGLYQNGSCYIKGE